MTKQEKIKEQVAERILGYVRACEQAVGFGLVEDGHNNLAKLLLEYLHSQGVVIKVDRELPYLEHWDWRQRQHAKNVYYDLLLNAGYVAVESLVGD